MASTAIYSKTNLFILSGSTTAEIPNVTNIGGPNFSKSEIEISTMQSTAREYKAAALADPGTLNFGIQYNPASLVHQYIVTQSASQGTEADYFAIKFSDGTSWRFSGSFLEFSISAEDPAQGILTANCSVRLSGTVNFISGSLT